MRRLSRVGVETRVVSTGILVDMSTVVLTCLVRVHGWQRELVPTLHDRLVDAAATGKDTRWTWTREVCPVATTVLHMVVVELRLPTGGGLGQRTHRAGRGRGRGRVRGGLVHRVTGSVGEEGTRDDDKHIRIYNSELTLYTFHLLYLCLSIPDLTYWG